MSERIYAEGPYRGGIHHYPDPDAFVRANYTYSNRTSPGLTTHEELLELLGGEFQDIQEDHYFRQNSPGEEDVMIIDDADNEASDPPDTEDESEMLSLDFDDEIARKS